MQQFDYSHLVTGRRVPDMPVDPPDPSDEEYERNTRNSCREEAIEALGTAISRLDELDHDGKERHTQKYLENLRDYLVRDFET